MVKRYVCCFFFLPPSWVGGGQQQERMVAQRALPAGGEGGSGSGSGTPLAPRSGIHHRAVSTLADEPPMDVVIKLQDRCVPLISLDLSGSLWICLDLSLFPLICG